MGEQRNLIWMIVIITITLILTYLRAILTSQKPKQQQNTYKQNTKQRSLQIVITTIIPLYNNNSMFYNSPAQWPMLI
jgi:heme/copper-type cytochrome/quinol oxidase subunit 2